MLLCCCSAPKQLCLCSRVLICFFASVLLCSCVHLCLPDTLCDRSWNDDFSALPRADLLKPSPVRKAMLGECTKTPKLCKPGKPALACEIDSGCSTANFHWQAYLEADKHWNNSKYIAAKPWKKSTQARDIRQHCFPTCRSKGSPGILQGMPWQHIAIQLVA